jgi:hypothetical protein
VNRPPYPALNRAIRQLLRHYSRETAAAALWAVTVTPITLAEALQHAGLAAAPSTRVLMAHPDLRDLDAMLDHHYRTDET